MLHDLLWIAMSVITFITISLYFYNRAKREKWDAETEYVLLSGAAIALASAMWPVTLVIAILILPAKRIAQKIVSGLHS